MKKNNLEFSFFSFNINNSKKKENIFILFLIKLLESILLLFFTFIVLIIIYKIFYGYTYNRFTDIQLEQIIKRNIDNKSFSYKYVSFNGLRHNESVVVFGDSNFDFSNYLNNTNINIITPKLYIFVKVSKNPIEEIIFKGDLYDFKKTFELTPYVDYEEGESTVDYEITNFFSKKIDIGNDGNEEIFFCLNGFGGSGFPSYCSIYDGNNFITPFPPLYGTIYNKKNIEVKYNEDYNNNSKIIKRSQISKEPIYSSFHSDNYFYLDDKNNSLYFLNMIWGENESHADAHSYEIFKYKILNNYRDFFNSFNRYIYYLDYKGITKESDKGKPEEVLLKIINGDGYIKNDKY